MCHLRSETLRVSPILSHPPDPDTRSLQLFHHFPPRFSSAATPITRARRRHRTSGEWGGIRIHIHRISFKESGMPRQLVCAFLPPP